MWENAVSGLACPRCRGALHKILDGEGHGTPQPAPRASSQALWIETGLLSCDACKVIYPVHRGVPILLTYRTKAADLALASLPKTVGRQLREQGYQLSSDKAPRGEEFVARSFSTEWDSYDYGPTLWTAPTADRLKAFRGECGLRERDLDGKQLCEIGCGLGILTNEAVALGAEAWGMDLSTSVFRAAAQFKSNPRVHFVQGSIFSAPFSPQRFDFVYSHGVLHHTWSTREAVRRAAELVRAQGTLYVWLYGYDDVRVSLARRLTFAFEALTRPLIARLPSPLATAALLPLAPVYQLASYFGRRSGTHGATYTPKQALHAARDRFTPLFAHRHEFDEVTRWLGELGLRDIHKVLPTDVPSSWAIAIKRNVAIRARR
jgi:2-polyprenyl-3-methyl-5-hydroxy-6-metoxy-1,4-benzoquinol methylase